MQPLGICLGVTLAALVRVFDQSLVSVLAAGLLSSMVLLSASSIPPSLTVSQLEGLGGDSAVTVTGLLVSLRSYDSGAEVLVVADESGPATVKVVCVPGPGQPPSGVLSIGDLISVSGECVFEDGTPLVYCKYNGIDLLSPSEEVLTIRALCASWQLFEGDRILIAGVSAIDETGALRLSDTAGASSIAMLLNSGVEPVQGEVLVDCVLVLDAATMSLVLRVDAMVPVG